MAADGKSWAKIGGVCGFFVGLAAVPFVPVLSTAAKIAVVSAVPVIGAVGISSSLGAFIGAAFSHKKQG